MTRLRCRACAQDVEVTGGGGQAAQMCPRCWGPLDLVYDLEVTASQLSRGSVAAGPPTMWRWAPLLPVAVDPTLGLGIGQTPLVRADRLAVELGLGELWLKDDGRNPTGSFKDRVVATALGRARLEGRTVAACGSTGNLAHSVAALAARAGMQAVVLVSVALDSLRLAAIAAHGATLVTVDGSYDQVNRLTGELAAERPDWAWVNIGLRPWYVDGARTLAYEVVEQLGWRAPDHVVGCMASGSLMTKIHQGFTELLAMGLADGALPRITTVQPAGCAPVATAFAAGEDEVRPVRPDTRATSLAMGDPPDGEAVLAVARHSGGVVGVVPEGDIAGAQALLARTEGILTEPAGGVVVAGLARLAASGTLRPDHRVVACLTGAGWKSLGATVPGVAPPVPVAPTLEALARAHPSLFAP